MDFVLYLNLLKLNRAPILFLYMKKCLNHVKKLLFDKGFRVIYRISINNIVCGI